MNPRFQFQAHSPAIRIGLVLVTFALCIATTEADQSGKTTNVGPYTISGIVVDPSGAPLEGVEYWISAYFDKNGAPIMYSGLVQKYKTEKDGVFRCKFGGGGRPWDKAVDIAFYHSEYAPAWLLKTSGDLREKSFALEKGVELTGVVRNPESERSGRIPLLQSPLEITLDVIHVNHPIRLRSTLAHKGNFRFRIPSNYWDWHYSFTFAGQPIPFKLTKDVPVPKIVIENNITIKLVAELDSTAQNPTDRP